LLQAASYHPRSTEIPTASSCRAKVQLRLIDHNQAWPRKLSQNYLHN
jgi:hypothetical protein